MYLSNTFIQCLWSRLEDVYPHLARYGKAVWFFYLTLVWISFDILLTHESAPQPEPGVSFLLQGMSGVAFTGNGHLLRLVFCSGERLATLSIGQTFLIMVWNSELGVEVHACSPSPQEAEAGGLRCQLELYNKIASQNKWQSDICTPTPVLHSKY